MCQCELTLQPVLTHAPLRGHWKKVYSEIVRGNHFNYEGLLFFTAPNNPPQNISIENDDPYSLTFDFAPPLVPNGVLTAYTFYVRFDNGTSIVIVDRTLTGRFVLRNLQPYQLVTIEVSANTSAGEGPKSDVDEIRTAQAGIIIAQQKYLRDKIS